MVIEMNERDQIMVDFYRKQVVHALSKLKRRGYLPVWGELFDALHQLKTLAHKYKVDVHIYDIYPTGALVYSMEKEMFAAMIQELHTFIYMDINECIDFLQLGRFSPFPSK
ncbi:hypothetical protein ACQCN2_15420 [Brevibacillus ginsengisoli]|uniref:hypothetical protein n=1 Tax=Brevibacillus ginsengisoli TaxID=363854 RepID=UPI003CEB8E3E